MTGAGRRTIMGGDAPPYRGPNQILNYYHSAFKDIKRKVRGTTKIQPCPFPLESQRVFLSLWATGCRVGESVMLKPDMFQYSENAFGANKLPVLKKREKIRDKDGNIIYKEVMSKVRQQDGSITDQVIYRPETKQKIEYRKLVVPREMPLVEELIKQIEYLKTQGYDYLLSKHSPFQHIPVKRQPCSVTIVEDRINELHPDLFPHGIRALHARFLRKHYGRERFDLPELKQHFRWSSIDMAVHYLGGQDLAETMGLEVTW